MRDLRYPIGKFSVEGDVTAAIRESWIHDLANQSGLLREAVAGLSEEQLDTPYRPDGWTLRQVVHHIADAGINGYTRFKLALTEPSPTIKMFDEEGWAELQDSLTAPVELSLTLLDGLSARWALLLSSLPDEAFQRTFVHPVSGVNPLQRALGFFAWHGRHHTAHITSLRERMGWQ